MHKNLVAGAVALLAACAWAQVTSPSSAGHKASATPVQASVANATAAPLKIGYVYLTPVLPTGWTHQHDLGRQAVEQHFGARVQTTVVTDVPEGPDAERVIRELAQQGNRLIFTTSFGYAQPALRVAREFPMVKFETITGLERAPNVATANARQYEGRYLAGVVAGLTSTTGKAGFVVGFAIPEVLQGVNAFTLGMRSVNPKAQVNMVVLNMRRAAPHAQLLAVTHHWGDYDIARVQAMLDGRWASTDTWGGVRAGMVKVGDFGPSVKPAIQRRVLAAQADSAKGKLQPFRGPIRDREGKLRVPAGQVASDAQLRAMDWLTEGVVGALP